MTVGGWIMMICMWGGVIALGIYCFCKILSKDNNSSL